MIARTQMDEPKHVGYGWRDLRPWVAPSVAAAALISAWWWAAVNFSQTGWDFAQFYIAAKLPVSVVYDREAAKQFGAEHLAPIGVHYYPPYVRPAVFAVTLRPLAMLDYWPAFWTWAAVSLTSYAGAIYLIFRAFGLPPLLLPAFFAFFPAMWSVVTGQDSGVYLLAFTAAVVLLQRGDDVWAGCLFALCLYRFNMAALVPLLLLAKQRYRAFVSWTVMASALVLASVSLADVPEYLALLGSIKQETVGFELRGLRGTLESYGMQVAYPPLVLAALAGWALFVRKSRLVPAVLVTIVVTLLVSPHSMWYDQTLLVLPIAGLFAQAGWLVRAAAVTILGCPFIWIFDNGLASIAIDIALVGFTVWLSAQLTEACPDEGSTVPTPNPRAGAT